MNVLEARHGAIRRALDCRGWDYRALSERTAYSVAAIKRYMSRLKNGRPGSKSVEAAIDAVLGGVICG